jgi:dihydroorotate dehydrogenase
MKELFFSRLARPALFSLPPEQAHHISVRALASGLVPACGNAQFPGLKVTVAGLEFPNPLGIAAGYDKNAEVPGQLMRLGFGFAEIGTVTPRPQSGNPKPRVFRLKNQQAIINRLGFNNEGHKSVLQRLQKRRKDGILGVNIGANKDSSDFIADYVTGIETFAEYASYFTINISSPNTPGLRNLQAAEILKELLDRVFEACLVCGAKAPVFLKIAPDLEDSELDEIASVVNASELDGIIISNTTIDKSAVTDSRYAGEQGGLSGKPLFVKSTIILAKMRQRLKPELPIIGVGGVDSVETTIAKMEAGADLVQIYTGLIYQGPGLPGRILAGLGKYLAQNNLRSIAEITGTKTAEWANHQQKERS